MLWIKYSIRFSRASEYIFLSKHGLKYFCYMSVCVCCLLFLALGIHMPLPITTIKIIQTNTLKLALSDSYYPSSWIGTKGRLAGRECDAKRWNKEMKAEQKRNSRTESLQRWRQNSGISKTWCKSIRPWNIFNVYFYDSIWLASIFSWHIDSYQCGTAIVNYTRRRHRLTYEWSTIYHTQGAQCVDLVFYCNNVWFLMGES